MSAGLVERAEAAVGRSRTVFSDAAAAPFVPHGGQSHIPQFLSGATISNMALSIQQLNDRVGRLENFVIGLESTLTSLTTGARGGVAALRTGTSGCAGLFQLNSVSDLSDAVSEALAPVRETLRQHERIIGDIVTAMNALDAWKVASASSTLVRGKEVGSHVPAVAASAPTSANSQLPTQERAPSTFHDVEARVRRLRQLAATIAELPNLPLVPPSHVVGHASAVRNGSKVSDKSLGSGSKHFASLVDPDQSSTSAYSTSANTTSTTITGDLSTTRTGPNDAGIATADVSRAETRGGAHRTFQQLVDVTDGSTGGDDTDNAARDLGGDRSLLSRVQRILGGEISAADLTGDERRLFDTSSNSDDAYRELIRRLQIGGRAGHYDTSSPAQGSSDF